MLGKPAESCAVRPRTVDLFSFQRVDRHGALDKLGCGGGELVPVEASGDDVVESAGEKGEEHSVDLEDVAPKRLLPSPYQPTQSEIEEHMVDHIPFRAWCKCCLDGVWPRGGPF